MEKESVNMREQENQQDPGTSTNLQPQPQSQPHSSLEPTKLANEDPLLQAQTKIDMLEKLKERLTTFEHQMDNPYPWLDSDDPRWKITDEEILSGRKERLIHLMVEKYGSIQYPR